MVLNLIQAFLVAALVLGPPGYLWSRVLFAASDWAERFASTIAMSVALVPLLALLLARILGTGITLGVSIAACCLVTGLGAVVWWRFHSVTPAEAEWQMEAPTLRAAALIPLILAGCCVVASFLRLLPARTLVPYTLLFVVVSGALHLLARPLPRAEGRVEATIRDHPASVVTVGTAPGRRGAGLLLPFIRRFALPAVLLLVAARGYVGPALYDWPFIRGMDHYNHTVMVNLVLDRGAAGTYMVYPPGYHVLSAILVRLSGLSPLELYAVLGPGLMLLPAIASYIVARRLFGWGAGVVAALFGGVLLNSQWMYLRDGIYVDMLAAEFLLALTFVALTMLLHSPSVRNGILVVLLGSTIVFYHTISTYYEVLLLGLVSVLWLPYLLIRDRRRALTLVATFGGLGVLAVAYAWDTYDLLATIQGLLGTSDNTDAAGHVSMVIGTEQPFVLGTVPAYLGQTVVWLGLLGMLLLVANLRRIRAPEHLPAVLLLGWAVVFFVASRTSLSGFPLRFTRDLGLPLAVLASLAVVAILRSTERRTLLSLGAAGVMVVMVALQLQRNYNQATRPSRQLLMTPEFKAAGHWLQAHNTGGNIIVSPHQNQVPGSAMLATGGYEGLMGFTQGQLGLPRVVPARDRPEVVAAHWVLQHPDGEKTRKILTQYDVRHVVFYKRFRSNSLWDNKVRFRPGPFKREPALYQVAYENPGVVIYKVRGR